MRYLKSKKAGSFSIYGEAILSVMLVLIVVSTLVLPSMNSIYDKSYSTGMNTSALEEWQDLESKARGQTGGEVTQTNSDSGLSLTTSWAIAKAVYNAIVSFATGGFIDTLVVEVLRLPAPVAWVLKVLWLLSLIYIIIKLFFKVNP